jgi:Glucodextranase, domain B
VDRARAAGVHHAGGGHPRSGGDRPRLFLIKGSAQVPDGGEAAPQGTVTFSNPPDAETIIGTTSNTSRHFSWIELHYARTVAATGSVALGFAYANAFTASEVVAEAKAAAEMFRPSVAITSPSRGTVTSASSVTVSGKATDANGLTAVSVGGVRVPVTPDGSWSTTVPLAPGTNTIAATATNVFGNALRAQIAVYSIHRPRLSKLRQAHRVWRESGRPGGRRPPIGTAFSFSLNEVARVSLRFAQDLQGRRAGDRCVAPTERNRRRRSCERSVTVGTMTVPGNAGANRVPFQGRLIGARKLAPGSYTLIITATNMLTGQHSPTHRLTFTIEKPVATGFHADRRGEARGP